MRMISEEHKRKIGEVVKKMHIEGKYPPPWNKGKKKIDDSRIMGRKVTGKNKICLVCEKSFWTIPSQEKRRKFCSYKCYNKYYSENYVGENCPSWKGGKTKPNVIRNTIQYKTWRSFVFGKNLYTCQLCGCRGGILNAHHILPRRVFPEYWHNKDNGITLCEPCHYSIKNKEWLYIPRFLGI